MKLHKPFNYNLENNGDLFEQAYWQFFIKDRFPNYEKFWLKYVVPLTNRPDNVHFKTDAELEKINKSRTNICIAQLNYSILLHLGRCFRIKTILESDPYQQYDLLLEGIARLVGAQDNALELLERFKNPNDYKPFEEKEGKRARDKLYDKNKGGFPLQHIRDYRNNLLHGRMFPSIIDGTKLCLPEIGKEGLYLDWRLTTNSSLSREEHKKNFIPVLRILEKAWDETIDYLNNAWVNL